MAGVTATLIAGVRSGLLPSNPSTWVRRPCAIWLMSIGLPPWKAESERMSIFDSWITPTACTRNQSTGRTVTSNSPPQTLMPELAVSCCVTVTPFTVVCTSRDCG